MLDSFETFERCLPAYWITFPEQFTYIQNMNVFVVESICFTSPKQDDLLIDCSTRVVISIKETLASELHDCSRRAWKRVLPPRAKSRQKSLMKNRLLRFQMRSLKKMIPATIAPWQQPAHSVPSPNIRSAQKLLLWERRNRTPKTIRLDWIWVKPQDNTVLVADYLVFCWDVFVPLLCIIYLEKHGYTLRSKDKMEQN